MLCTAAVRTIKEPEMVEQLDRLGVRVVLKPFDIEELLRVLAETVAAQALIAQTTDEKREGVTR